MAWKRFWCIAIALVACLGCGGGSASRKATVLVPPRVDLGAYDRIGMLVFASNETGDLDQVGTREFLQSVQESQPGTPILELGDATRVLDAVEHETLDRSAIQAIGQRYDVDALILGDLAVTELEPRLSLSREKMSMSVRAEVEAEVSARLLETEGGATLWTRSVRGRETVAHAKLARIGPSGFGADPPDEATERLLRGLVHRLTQDFRARYEKR